jgi:hypothetical protein
MKQRVNLNKKVYNKDNYQKTIDTSFKELLPPPPPEEVSLSLTIEQFFQAYNDLFFDIPKTGNNSHNTLIQQSIEYVGNEQKDEQVDALIQEINDLRTQLLSTQQDLLETQQAQSEDALNNINV